MPMSIAMSMQLGLIHESLMLFIRARKFSIFWIAMQLSEYWVLGCRLICVMKSQATSHSCDLLITKGSWEERGCHSPPQPPAYRLILCPFPAPSFQILLLNQAHIDLCPSFVLSFWASIFICVGIYFTQLTFIRVYYPLWLTTHQNLWRRNVIGTWVK